MPYRRIHLRQRSEDCRSGRRDHRPVVRIAHDGQSADPHRQSRNPGRHAGSRAPAVPELRRRCAAERHPGLAAGGRRGLSDGSRILRARHAAGRSGIRDRQHHADPARRRLRRLQPRRHVWLQTRRFARRGSRDRRHPRGSAPAEHLQRCRQPAVQEQVPSGKQGYFPVPRGRCGQGGQRPRHHPDDRRSVERGQRRATCERCVDRVGISAGDHHRGDVAHTGGDGRHCLNAALASAGSGRFQSAESRRCTGRFRSEDRFLGAAASARYRQADGHPVRADPASDRRERQFASRVSVRAFHADRIRTRRGRPVLPGMGKEGPGTAEHSVSQHHLPSDRQGFLAAGTPGGQSVRPAVRRTLQGRHRPARAADRDRSERDADRLCLHRADRQCRRRRRGVAGAPQAGEGAAAEARRSAGAGRYPRAGKRAGRD